MTHYVPFARNIRIIANHINSNMRNKLKVTYNPISAQNTASLYYQIKEVANYDFVLSNYQNNMGSNSLRPPYSDIGFVDGSNIEDVLSYLKKVDSHVTVNFQQSLKDTTLIQNVRINFIQAC